MIVSRVKPSRLAPAWLALLATALGCGGKDRLEVAPVSGQILYKGQGVPRATVIFHPDGASATKAGRLRPFAYADDEGKFQLKTYVTGDGAPPGDYRVCIIAASVGPAARTKDQPVSAGPDSAGPSIQIPPAITERYANVETSGIKVEVKEGENILDPFEL